MNEIEECARVVFFLNIKERAKISEFCVRLGYLCAFMWKMKV